MRFRWTDQNTKHAQKHGLTIDQIERAVEDAREPFPWMLPSREYIVWEKVDGLYIQVIAFDTPDDEVFVIHARKLTRRERRQFKE